MEMGKGGGRDGACSVMGWSGRISLRSRHLRKPKEVREGALLILVRKNIPGRGNCKCKGPEAGRRGYARGAWQRGGQRRNSLCGALQAVARTLAFTLSEKGSRWSI